MKTTKNILLLIVFIVLISVQLTFETKVMSRSRQVKKFGSGDTPKGIDLANHYGHRSLDSPFAPQNTNAENVQSNIENYLPQNNLPFAKALKELEYKPKQGDENKMNPTKVKSGEFLNLAPSARGLVTPLIAGPKLRVDATVNYPALAEMPAYKGFINEYKDVNIYDRETGQIYKDRLTVNHPWLVKEKTVFILIHPSIR